MLQNVTDFDFSREISHSKCYKYVTNLLQIVTNLLQTSFSNVTKRYKTLQTVTTSNACMFCVILCDFCLSSFLLIFVFQCLFRFVTFCQFLFEQPVEVHAGATLSASIVWDLIECKHCLGPECKHCLGPECKHCLGPDRVQTLFGTFEDMSSK